MDRFSHFQYVTRLTYQLVSYILQQLPQEYECLIDADKFFEAISISVEAEQNPNLVNKRINPGPWKYAPHGAAIDAMKDLSQSEDLPQDAQSSFDMRRNHYITWVNHCQNRGRFIPYRYNYNYKEEKTRITLGKIGTSRPKGSNSKGPYIPSTSISNQW
jgi:hypothetical protein